MTGHAVTTNPFLIMVINMVIVFSVLWILGYIIRLIHWIDPTKKKAAPEIAPAAVTAQPVQTIEPADEGQIRRERTLVAIVTTAIMAYGYQNVKVKSIKRV